MECSNVNGCAFGNLGTVTDTNVTGGEFFNGNPLSSAQSGTVTNKAAVSGGEFYNVYGTVNIAEVTGSGRFGNFDSGTVASVNIYGGEFGNNFGYYDGTNWNRDAVTADNNGTVGSVNLYGGSFHNNGNAGDVNLYGGQLTGNGTIGNLLVGSGGTFDAARYTGSIGELTFTEGGILLINGEKSALDLSARSSRLSRAAPAPAAYTFDTINAAVVDLTNASV